MQTILTSIAKVIAIPIVSILTLAGYDVSSSVPLQQKINTLDNKVQSIGTEVNQVKLGAYNPTGGGTYRLQSSIGSTDTTIKLSSFKEPVSNLPYTMSYLNTSVAYGTLDPQQPTRSEFISFTGITQNADGTATLTGVTRGLARSYPYTASSTLRQTHSGQSIFILSDSPQHFAEYAVKANDEHITGTWTFDNFPITASTTYASETVAGASELATGIEIASSTSVGGTTRRLTIPASLATSTYNSATAGLKVVVTQNSGKIDTNFLASNVVTTTGNNTFTGVNTFSTTTATSTMVGSMPAYWIGKNIQVFTSSGTFVPPAGVNKVTVQVQGGGGSGGTGFGNGGAGGGGGSGAYCLKNADISATTSISVIVGGNSSFGPSFCSSTAGSNGSSGAAGGGGTATGGDININGTSGIITITECNGGGCNGFGGAGAGSFFGSGGSGGKQGTSAVTPSAYGAGGGGNGCDSGGTCSSASGGAPGIVIITW